MKKLTSLEGTMLYFLRTEGPFCPGTPADPKMMIVRSVCDGLVRKKRATVEATDDGPRYTALPEVR